MAWPHPCPTLSSLSDLGARPMLGAGGSSQAHAVVAQTCVVLPEHRGAVAGCSKIWGFK